MAKKKDIRIDVKIELDRQERNISWLAKKTKIPYSTLYGILVHGIQEFNQERIDKVNTVLGTSFTLPQ